MWGLREWRKVFLFPFPPLVCGPPSTFFDVMLCKFRDREGMEMFCRVEKKKTPQEPQKMKDHPSVWVAEDSGNGNSESRNSESRNGSSFGQQKRQHVQITCAIAFDLWEEQLKSVYLSDVTSSAAAA